MFASQDSLARRATPLVTDGIQELLWRIEPFASAWLLGFVFAAMLLGHWYLNAPGMKLEPLKTLHRWAFAAHSVARRILDLLFSARMAASGAQTRRLAVLVLARRSGDSGKLSPFWS